MTNYIEYQYIVIKCFCALCDLIHRLIHRKSQLEREGKFDLLTSNRHSLNRRALTREFSLPTEKKRLNQRRFTALKIAS